MPPRKHRLLLIRNFRHPTGGNLKVRDYFDHLCAHPDFDADIWFPSESRHAGSDIWADLPTDHLIPDTSEPSWNDYDFVAVNGKDWLYLPTENLRASLIHFVQHLGYADDLLLRSYLRREAWRICTNPILRDAIAPHAAGPIRVVPMGLDDALFTTGTTKITGRVLIHGRKQPHFASELTQRLRALGIDVHLLGLEWTPHAEVISRLHTADILVGIPSAVEGLYLPSLEGMAARCVVVCSDAIGNRTHCIPGETCLQPPAGDLNAHLSAIGQALTDEPLRAYLRHTGHQLASRHTLHAERAAFHAVLTEAAVYRTTHMRVV